MKKSIKQFLSRNKEDLEKGFNEKINEAIINAADAGIYFDVKVNAQMKKAFKAWLNTLDREVNPYVPKEEREESKVDNKPKPKRSRSIL